MADLAAFIVEARRTPFAYGAHDCLLWPANWVVLNGHPDPAAPYRGRYRSMRGAMSFVAAAGGVLRLARAGMARAGLAAVEPADAVSGDVGVGVFGVGSDWSESALAAEPMGLIRAGDRWVALCAGVGPFAGPTIGPAQLLAAWRV